VAEGFEVDAALGAALERAAGCNLIAFLDVGASQLLGVRAAEPLELTEWLGPAVHEFFEGAAAASLAAVLRPLRQDPPAGPGFQDIIICAADMVQIFMRSPKLPGYAVMTVWFGLPNLGLVLSKARNALAVVEDFYA
jgi:hypothetical protein